MGGTAASARPTSARPAPSPRRAPPPPPLPPAARLRAMLLPSILRPRPRPRLVGRRPPPRAPPPRAPPPRARTPPTPLPRVPPLRAPLPRVLPPPPPCASLLPLRAACRPGRSNSDDRYSHQPGLPAASRGGRAVEARPRGGAAELTTTSSSMSSSAGFAPARKTTCVHNIHSAWCLCVCVPRPAHSTAATSRQSSTTRLRLVDCPKVCVRVSGAERAGLVQTQCWCARDVRRPVGGMV